MGNNRKKNINKMKKRIVFLMFIFLTINLFGQENKQFTDFKSDFNKAIRGSFSVKMLDKMFSEYSELLTPHSDITQLMEKLKGNEVKVFPLYDFKKDKLYIDNIDILLNSKNPNQRILAYLVIASSDDLSKESVLLKKITTEVKKGNLLWAGMALLYIKCNHTTELFDFLVKNEDFGDAHMFPMFIQLDKDSLQQTAYTRINSKDTKSKILAAQILSVTPLNSETERILIQSVKNWDIGIKGYAIYSIKELQIGNLLETFKPLLDDKRTRSVSLQALANSPTKADRDYLIEQLEKQDIIQSEILDCLYESSRVENIKCWLRLLKTRQIPKNYSFFVFKQPLIKSDSVLFDLQTTLESITDKHILGELVRALSGRTDQKSIDIITTLLKNKSSTVRYWTAITVENNNSDKFKVVEISKLIKQGLEEGNTPDE